MGEYLPMFNRPYLVSATKNAIDTISDRMSDAKAGAVTSSIVNGIANEIIQPSAVGYETSVNHSWVTTKRYIFILKVKSFDMTGVEINSYIQGYTDYDGITNTGNIDSNLVHHINNVIETTNITYTTPLGVVRKEKLLNIYNIFSSSGGTENTYSQRPKDILDHINALSVSSVMENAGDISVYASQSLINPFNSNVVASSVGNNIATEYLSKVLTSGIHANKNDSIFINSYSIGDSASNDKTAPEPSVSDNRFLKYLSRTSGFKFTRDIFNFSQLMNIDNSIYNRFKVIMLNKDYINPQISNTPTVGDYWHGQDPVTVKAYSIIESSVSLALKYGFNKLYFTVSNMSNITGVSDIFITNFNSFINLEEHDFNYLLEIFKDKYIQEIFLNETNCGTIPLHIDVYIDLLGTSKLYLAYAGYSGNWYTIPTFANSMFSPVLTVNKESLDLTAFQLGQVIESLSNTQQADRAYY